MRHLPCYGKARAVHFALVSCLLAVGTSLGQSIAYGQLEEAVPTTAYTRVTIESMGEPGRVEEGTLVVKGGKIVAVGEDVEIPVDARIISLEGKTITPGWIDPYFVLRTGGNEDTELSRRERLIRRFRRRSAPSFTPGPFRTMAEFFYPYDAEFMPAVRSGVTTVNFVSEGRGLSALGNIYPEPDPEMLFQTSGYLFAKITNQTRALDIVRNGLEGDSSSNRNARRRGGRGRRGPRSGRPDNRVDGTQPLRGAPGSSLLQEEEGGGDEEAESADEQADESKTEAYWRAVRQGEKPLFVNVNNAAAAAYLLQIIEDHPKVKLALVATGDDIYELLDEIPRDRVSLVLPPSIDELPLSSDKVNVSALAEDRGLPLAFSLSLNYSQLRASQDDPMFPIAMLVRTGLDRQTALEALTTAPAKLLGIEKTRGSLEPGKFADFLVFSQDPLATGSRLQQVILEGRLVYED